MPGSVQLFFRVSVSPEPPLSPESKSSTNGGVLGARQNEGWPVRLFSILQKAEHLFTLMLQGEVKVLGTLVSVRPKMTKLMLDTYYSILPTSFSVFQLFSAFFTRLSPWPECHPPGLSAITFPLA
jgi:hypothetical protein